MKWSQHEYLLDTKHSTGFRCLFSYMMVTPPWAGVTMSRRTFHLSHQQLRCFFPKPVRFSVPTPTTTTHTQYSACKPSKGQVLESPQFKLGYSHRDRHLVRLTHKKCLINVVSTSCSGSMRALCRTTRGATRPHSLEITALGTIISLISFHINADLMPW